jgi:hypothetical protein
MTRRLPLGLCGLILAVGGLVSAPSASADVSRHAGPVRVEVRAKPGPRLIRRVKPLPRAQLKRLVAVLRNRKGIEEAWPRPSSRTRLLVFVKSAGSTTAVALTKALLTGELTPPSVTAMLAGYLKSSAKLVDRDPVITSQVNSQLSLAAALIQASKHGGKGNGCDRTVEPAAWRAKVCKLVKRLKGVAARGPSFTPPFLLST